MAKSITYRFEVMLTLPLTPDPMHPDFYTEAQATSQTHRSRLEKALYEAARRLDGGDADAQLLDYSIDDDGIDTPHDSECECEQCRMERCMPEEMSR